ncbi:uncharacterized protein LAJ45_01708 [Morchella importuna]|uniref:uncharacterized protein n=1 Tax=Morchella importuna TaxID=1174673 RepID=UPI001E8EB814|nr:uncharacterized protein LAJ45_01708 [Morchella importuna]KAH8153941.1 hypothetical protein LAJ45_01708 [Morchella importuna]
MMGYEVPPSPLSPAEQARIRRERRQAKVKSSAGARLNRITSTQGQTFRQEEPTPARDEPTPDPPEIDISAHHYEPKARQQDRLQTENVFANMINSPMAGRNSEQPSDADLRQMLMSMNQGPPPGMNMPGMGVGGSGGEDPMMAMLQQMMAGGGGMPGMAGPGMQMPPGMEGMMGAMGMPPQQQGNDWGSWWRILHSLCALLLGLWAVKATEWSFSGSALQRAESANFDMDEKPQLFWYFTTMELVLQSSRFFLEKGRPPQAHGLAQLADSCHPHSEPT